MRMLLTSVAAIAGVMTLAGCERRTDSAPAADTPPPAAEQASPNFAPLGYAVSQHSPLLDAEAKSVISQDFNGAPLNGAPAHHQVTAESVRCRALNPPDGAPDCTVTYREGQEIAIGGDDAIALFAALGAAGVRDDAGMGHIVREISALQCTVDDAAAQDTPATGDRVSGFSCSFAPV